MIDRIKELKGAHLRGEVHLSTVSGVASTKPSMVRFFDREIDAIDVITTKSFQVNPNPGNREPVICEIENGSFGNSVGLRNPGLASSLPPLEKLRKEGLKKYLNVSVSASTPEDFITLVKGFDDVASSIELNFSCPHASAGFGASIGCDINIATEYVRRIREAYPEQKSALIVKLTPNVDNIGAIAASVIAAGADGIAAINTVGPERYPLDNTEYPILNNKLNGKGGKSGFWVHERALECVKEIRKAIGDEPIIIGMGGVSSGKEARALIEAGADAVGIGSALGKVSQKQWKEYLSSVKAEAEGKKCTPSSSFLRTFNEMEYTRREVTKVTLHTKDILLIELSGTLDCHAGEFAFLLVPGKGEKPFSVAHNKPLTFLIRRRGFFTEALFDLKVGDMVYTRGLYGAALERNPHKNSLLIAGGSGVAVLPSVCRMLEEDKGSIEVLVGTTAEVKGCDGKALFEDFFAEYGSYEVVADDGKPGHVLERIPSRIKKDMAAYLVGPEKFMSAAAKILVDNNISTKDIYLSLERSTLCGIGMCGECGCGDRLTCQWGTFQSYEYILENAPELL